MNDVKRIDELHRMVLRRREKACYVCGGEPHDVAHLFVRSKLATRFDVAPDGNCHMLCRGCHMRDHNGDSLYKDRYVKFNGHHAYDALALRSNSGLSNVGIFLDKKERELNEDRDNKG